MEDVFIYKILRTPNAKKGGWYAQIPADLLMSKVLNSLSFIQGGGGEVILAHSIGLMGNIARLSLLQSSLKSDTVATTIDAQCGGVYKAIDHGFNAIRSNSKDWVIAGAMDSTSLQAQRNYHRHDPRYDDCISNLRFAQFAPSNKLSLNESAAVLAEEYGISKKTMQEWTLRSHLLATIISTTSIYKQSMVTIVKNGAHDQPMKPHLTMAVLEAAASAELIDRTTTCDLVDGAGAILMGSAAFGRKNKLKAIAQVERVSFVGLSPDESPKGALTAVERLLMDSNGYVNDYDLFEVCESYACKPLAMAQKFSIPLGRINCVGSNLAMGHPFASSGLVNVLNLYMALKQRGKQRGMVSAGIAGGLGSAISLKVL